MKPSRPKMYFIWCIFSELSEYLDLIVGHETDPGRAWRDWEQDLFGNYLELSIGVNLDTGLDLVRLKMEL